MRTRASVLLATLALGCGAEKPGPGPSVMAASLTGLALDVDGDATPLGKSKLWKATGTYSDVSWASSDPTIAEMAERSTTPGLMVTMARGRTSISASYQSLKVNQVYEVTAPVIDGLRITPGDLTIGIGKSIQLTAVGTLSDDSTANVTRMVTWSSSDENVARISATDAGYLVTFGRGRATITARVGEASATASFSITDSSVDFIDLTPADARIEVGSSVRLTAMGTFTDRNRVDITRQAMWTSAAPAVATVDGAGVVTGVGEGMASITATLDGVMKSVTVRVWVPGACNYPPPANAIRLNATAPQLEWLGAFREDGTQVDFRFEQFHCGEQWGRYTSVAFIIGAGWCPNCPDYMRRVNSMAQQLDAAGMLIAYVEAETRSRQPANNAQARDIVEREVPGALGLRLGDGDTRPLERAFSRAVSAFPTAFVLRKSDMKIIADQDAYRSRGYLPFLQIAQNPEAWSQ